MYKMIIDIIVFFIKVCSTYKASWREGGGQSRRVVMKVTATDRMWLERELREESEWQDSSSCRAGTLRSSPCSLALLHLYRKGQREGEERRGEERREGEGEVDFNKLVARGRPIPLTVS